MTRLEGFRCTDCGTSVAPPDARRCPDCGGVLDASYDYADATLEDLTRMADRRYDTLLPFSSDGMGEGDTPLVNAPVLADQLGVDRFLVKDESSNPTGSVVDRGMAMVAEAAVRAGADALTLATTGNGGQSAAAYAARNGLDSKSFVPSRATFVNKAMINVHGGEMRVVEGRYGDAVAAYEAERGERDDEPAQHDAWFPAGAFESPYRHEGLKPIYYELVAELGAVPDAIVAPVGHGTLPAALWKAARELDTCGVVDETPRIYVAQPEGCAPIVEAIRDDRDPEPWEIPDTVVGDLEIPDPAGGRPALEAVRASGGDAVAVSDDELLDSAATIAQHEGVAVSVASGTAVAAAWTLKERDELSDDDAVVVINTASGNKDADIVRSRLMSHGL